MRVLKPEIARERQDKILHWIIHEHIATHKPVSSDIISRKSGFTLSSASIRNIMKGLEEQGYLFHSHTSGGRIPTDKGYRFYVDYLLGAQKLALDEKDRIEGEYNLRMDELDRVMGQTSRMLAALSSAAGFALATSVEAQCVRRLDIVPVGSRSAIAVLVTDSGSVKHWPVRLNYEIPQGRLRLLSSYLNSRLAGLTLEDARLVLWEELERGASELRDISDLARHFLEDFGRQSENGEDIFVDGLGRLFESAGAGDFHRLQSLLGVMEEKKRFSMLLRERLDDCIRHGPHGEGKHVNVTIGMENEMAGLKDLSVISSTYQVRDRVAGMLGIIGPRHMEYSKMISLVDSISDIVGQTIERWERQFFASEEKVAPEAAKKARNVPAGGGKSNEPKKRK